MLPLEGITKFLVFFGITVSSLVVAAILVLLLYDKAKVVFSDLLRLFGGISKFVRKKSLETEIEGTINLFAKDFNSEMTTPFLPVCDVQWVTGGNQQSIIQPGKAIIRLSFSRDDHDLNFYNATFSFVRTALLHRTKPFLNEMTSRAIDLLATKILLRQGRRSGGLVVFNNKFREESQGCKDIYFRMEETDEKGLFRRILLQEYFFLGESLGEKTPREQYEAEADQFFEWLYQLSTREIEEKSTLAFEGEHVKVGVILVASDETYKRFGKKPYLRRADTYAANDFRCIYVLSRGQAKGKIVKEIVSELVATGGYENLTKRPDIVRRKFNERPIFITCIALKCNPIAVIQKAWELLKRDFEARKQVTVTIIDVTPDHLRVNAYGLSIEISNPYLSSMTIPNALKYFEIDQELLVNVVTFEPEKNLVGLSNVDTESDPKRLIDRLAPEKGVPVQCTVTKILTSNGLDTGLIVNIDRKDLRGFIPRSKATFSRFISLSEKYPIDSSIMAVPANFDFAHGNFICEIERLEAPWILAESYKEGMRVRATIRQISERYITCELKEGLEGRVYAEEVSWDSVENNLNRIMAFKVGEVIDATVFKLDINRRIFTLSIRRLTESPVLSYFNMNKDKVVTAIVRSILPRHATVTLSNEIRGYLHVSEVLWGYCQSISDHIVINQQVYVRLMEYNPDFDTIKVSLKRCVPNHFPEFKIQFQVGDVVRGCVDHVNLDRIGIKIKFGNNRSAMGYVHQSELSHLVFIDDATLKEILERERDYWFVIKRFDDLGESVELSRKRYFTNSFDDLVVGQEDYTIMINKSKRKLFLYGDKFEGILLLGKSAKPLSGRNFKVCIDRIDREKRQIDLKLITNFSA
jgi:ribosomal protein S1